jgi:hypothetical protein
MGAPRAKELSADKSLKLQDARETPINSINLINRTN